MNERVGGLRVLRTLPCGFTGSGLRSRGLWVLVCGSYVAGLWVTGCGSGVVGLRVGSSMFMGSGSRVEGCGF